VEVLNGADTNTDTVANAALLLVRAMQGLTMAPNNVKRGTGDGDGAPEPEKSINPRVCRYSGRANFKQTP